jgi:predicted AlkP superfamily pyrophosphatase or phosphodiesterase
MRHRRIWVVLVLMLALWERVPEGQAVSRAAEHVVIIMLDGVRADALRLARTPVISSLAGSGARYMQARTIINGNLTLDRTAYVGWA